MTGILFNSRDSGGGGGGSGKMACHPLVEKRLKLSLFKKFHGIYLVSMNRSKSE